MNNYYMVLLGGLYVSSGLPIQAASFGYMGDADLGSINGNPAICMRKDSEKALSVGWIIFSESYVRSSAGWGVRLKSGVKPLMLEPGACLELGVLPEGYELDDFKMRAPLFPLEVNSTYTFSLVDAYQSRDTYTVIFCVATSADGALRYLQYTHLPGGGKIIPACDARRYRE